MFTGGSPIWILPHGQIKPEFVPLPTLSDFPSAMRQRWPFLLPSHQRSAQRSLRPSARSWPQAPLLELTAEALEALILRWTAESGVRRESDACDACDTGNGWKGWKGAKMGRLVRQGETTGKNDIRVVSDSFQGLQAVPELYKFYIAANLPV